jgi:hypothetical protein
MEYKKRIFENLHCSGYKNQKNNSYVNIIDYILKLYIK